MVYILCCFASKMEKLENKGDSIKIYNYKTNSILIMPKPTKKSIPNKEI